MRCPKCKREIAFEAVSCRCGWSAVVSRPAPRQTSSAPMPPEVREKLEAMLGKARLFREKRDSAKPRHAAALLPLTEVTEGHGNCVCEICFAIRMKRVKKVDLKLETENGSIDGSGAAPEAEGTPQRHPTG